jgi:TRAP-type C4-dicarboxylate transport system substrate-binding protein
MSWLTFFFTKILCIHTGFFFSTAKWQKITSEKKKLLDVASGMIRTQFSKILLNKKYENKKMFNNPS